MAEKFPVELRSVRFRQRLSLWESWHRAAMTERARTLTAARLFPQETSAATAVFLCDPTRENAMPGGPQTARHCSIINNFSAEYAQSSAARIQNRPALLFHLSGQKRCRYIHRLELGGVRHGGAVFGQ